MEHKSSEAYIMADIASQYYNHKNPTISKYEKMIADIHGELHVNRYSPNHKIKSNIYRYFVTQLSQYCLGNGVSFGEETTKEKLGGNKFDTELMKCSKMAQNSGQAFLFFNFDSVKAFDLLEFVPLYDEYTGALRAGVRFWQIASNKPLIFTIYEEDGYTECEEDSNGALKVTSPKRGYIEKTATSEADGEQIIGSSNYGQFPIAVMKFNDLGESRIVGNRETIDAYDLTSSQMTNNTSEGALLYWSIKNCGGMTDEDAEAFIENIVKNRIAMMPNADEGAVAEPHTIEVPFQATQSTLDRLRQQLFEDFMALDVKSVSAGSVTATEIQSAYEPINSQADDFENSDYGILNCIYKILEIAGIEDTVTLTRSSMIANSTELIDNLLKGAEYLSRDYVTRKLLTILGDGDMAEEVIKQIEADEMSRYTNDFGESEENEEGEDEE